MTYVALANITLGSSASSVTFSSIPNTFRDLVLVVSTFQTNGADQFSHYRVNGDSGSNYNLVYMDTYGGSPSSGSSPNQTQALVEYHQSVSNTTPSTAIVQFMDYSATDKHKTQLHRFGAASPTVGAYATRWASTAAITSIVLTPNSSYLTGSTFALYGIAS